MTMFGVHGYPACPRCHTNEAVMLASVESTKVFTCFRDDTTFDHRGVLIVSNKQFKRVVAETKVPRYAVSYEPVLGSMDGELTDLVSS